MKYVNFDLTLTQSDTAAEEHIVNIFPSRKIGNILGFGGAFTEASAYNYSLLNPDQKKEFIRRYFSKKDGARYTFCRVHIGSCDFALNPYSEAYEKDLSDFSIDRDKKYIIPMIRDAQKEAGSSLFLFASPWSPPAFMKDNNSLNRGGKLLPEYYETYAEYFVRFVRAYAEEGIKISALTVQNEPKASQSWESCIYSAEEEADFAVNYLRPALDRAGLSDVKILIWDHNRERIVDRADSSFSLPRAKEAIWGLAFHWYSGSYYEGIDLFRQSYPDKVILESELCLDMREPKEDISAIYCAEYLNCLRRGVAGICDWNLLLDYKSGGPYHWRDGGCTSALYYDSEKHELAEDRYYQAVKTICAALDRGDTLLATTFGSDDVIPAAAKKSDGTILLFLQNRETRELPVHIRIDGRSVSFKAPEDSLCVCRIEP